MLESTSYCRRGNPEPGENHNGTLPSQRANEEDLGIQLLLSMRFSEKLCVSRLWRIGYLSDGFVLSSVFVHTCFTEHDSNSALIRVLMRNSDIFARWMADVAECLAPIQS